MAEATLVIEGFPVEVVWSQTSQSRKALSLERSEDSIRRIAGPHEHRVYAQVRLGGSEELRELLVASHDNDTYLEVLLPNVRSATIFNHFTVEHMDPQAYSPIEDNRPLFVHLYSPCRWELLS